MKNLIKINKSEVALTLFEKYPEVITLACQIKWRKTILHELAMVTTEFNESEKALVIGLINKWKYFPKNSYNRSYLETALAQKSPNKDFLVSVQFEANKKIERLIVMVLRKKGKLRTSNLNKILKYCRYNGIISEHIWK